MMISTGCDTFNGARASGLLRQQRADDGGSSKRYTGHRVRTLPSPDVVSVLALS